MAWHPATYDIISRNRRNWPSLNLSQNAREEQINNFWKREVLMFYPLGKYSKKLQEEGAGGGGGVNHQPPCTSGG